MSRFTPRQLVALSLCLLAVWTFSEVANAAEFPAPLKTLELNDGDTLVFLGDSITHQCLYTQYVEDFFYTRFPNKRIRFHNAGVGGAQAWDALQRFSRDVAPYKPKYVTVLLGMNDGRYQPFNQEIFDTYQKDMKEVVARIQETGATPVLMTPTMYDAWAARMKGQNEARQEYYNSVLAYYGTWLRDVAQRDGYGFVDMWSPLNNLTLAQRKSDPNFTMIQDAVHPGASGQLVMAYVILDDLGLRGPVSAIRINATLKSPNGNAMGGEISDLQQTENGLSFTWSAKSLPFVVPEEAQLGAKMLRLGHRASREALIVNGLPASEYELLIDGESVGKFPANRLAAGVELQENAKTPQYQQALKVAELNKKRNEGPVRGLRNEWGLFQAYARAKRQASENPDDAKAAENLKGLEARIEGMEERVAKHEADAKAIEDEIFQNNQPNPHRYELRRVGGDTAAAKNTPAGAQVKGLVTLNGQPVAGATVKFISESGKALQATTGEDGLFQVRGRTRAGAYKVVILSDRIPAKYSDEKQASLAAELVSGANQFDFDLRSE